MSLINPRDTVERHVEQTLGVRNQRDITGELDDAGRARKSKNQTVASNDIVQADAAMVNYGAGLHVAVEGDTVTITGGVILTNGVDPYGSGIDTIAITGTSLPTVSVVGTVVTLGFDSPQLYASGTTTAPAGSPDASTTSTGAYATAFSGTWTLPAGTWSVYGMGSCSFIHSASGVVDFYAEVNGSGALTRTPSLSSSAYSRWEDHVSASSVASDGATPITVKVLYRSNTAGTTTPQMPKVSLTAIRTG